MSQYICSPVVTETKLYKNYLTNLLEEALRNHPTPKKPQYVYLRGVDTCILINDLLNKVKEISSEVYFMKRLTNKFTGKPRQLIRLTCSEGAAEKILASEIIIKGTQIQTEKQRILQIIRCYKCQTYGHIAKNCRKQAVCENCSEQACESPCSNPPRCTNCSNEHPAFDTNCPVYIIVERIKTQKYSYRANFQQRRFLPNFFCIVIIIPSSSEDNHFFSKNRK